jgi:hypothetical protein
MAEQMRPPLPLWRVLRRWDGGGTDWKWRWPAVGPTCGIFSLFILFQNSLPRAKYYIKGLYVVSSLPRVAVGKPFAKGILDFIVC